MGLTISERLKDYRNSVSDYWKQDSFEINREQKTGYFANTKLGQILSGNMIEKDSVQKVLKNGFGVNVKEENIIDTILKEKGIKPSISGDDIRFDFKSGSELKLADEEIKLLKASGISEEVINDLKTKGTAVVKDGTQLKRIPMNKYGITAAEEGAPLIKKLLGKSAGKAVSKFGVTIAKGLTKVPVVGALITVGLEASNVVSAKEGDKLAQVGRSTSAIIGSTAGMVLGSFLGPVGTFAGAVVGDLAGRAVGNLLFGEPKGEETTAATTKSESTSTKSTSSNANIAAADTTDDVLLPYCKDMSFMSYC